MIELWIPLSFGLIQGFVSQIHCLGMCGPLVISSQSMSKLPLSLYQVGRLVGYLTLGFAVYLLGESAREVGKSFNLPYFAIGIMILYIIWMFISKILHINFPLGEKISSIYMIWNQSRFVKVSPYSRKFIFGLTSVFLPCGVLYTMIAQAYAQVTITQSLILVTGFFLGTSPAILGISKMQTYLAKILPESWMREWLQMGILILGLGIAYYRSTVLNCH